MPKIPGCITSLFLALQNFEFYFLQNKKCNWFIMSSSIFSIATIYTCINRKIPYDINIFWNFVMEIFTLRKYKKKMKRMEDKIASDLKVSFFPPKIMYIHVYMKLWILFQRGKYMTVFSHAMHFPIISVKISNRTKSNELLFYP